MKTQYLLVLVSLSSLLATVSASAQLTYTTLNGPTGATNVWAEGISGNTIVGYYQDASQKFHGFSYDGSSYTTLNDPLAGKSLGTQAYGVSGNDIVGWYSDAVTGNLHGFLYDGSTYTSLDDPAEGLEGTLAYGISGNTVVGTYYDSNGVLNGFKYDIPSHAYTTINDPMGTGGTQARGVDGNNIVGIFQNPNNGHGFKYDGANFTTIDEPDQYNVSTDANGISGNLIVGSYDGRNGTDSNGFTIQAEYGYVYDGVSYTRLSDPSADEELGHGTDAQDIAGNTVVGFYNAASGGIRGFEVTIPEPASVAICMITCAGLLLWRPRDTNRPAAR